MKLCIHFFFPFLICVLYLIYSSSFLRRIITFSFISRLVSFNRNEYREILSCAPFVSTAKYIFLFIVFVCVCTLPFILFISRIGKSIFLFLAFQLVGLQKMSTPTVVSWCQIENFKTATQSIRKTIFGLHATFNIGGVVVVIIVSLYALLSNSIIYQKKNRRHSLTIKCETGDSVVFMHEYKMRDPQ